MSRDYDHYTKTTYSGRKLLEKHSLSEEGHWHIFGEDPNCDFGGHHHNPDLGIVTGKLEEVIRYAVSLDNFWQWGGGGIIEKIQVKDAATARAAQLRIAEIDAQIQKLSAEKKKLLGA